MEDTSAQILQPQNPKRELEWQRDLYAVFSFLAGIAIVISVFYGSPAAIVGLVPFRMALKRVEKAARRLRREEDEERIGTTLLKCFKKQGIEVFWQVPVSEEQVLDLFVRFPDKQFFAISVLSLGPGKIFFNEREEILQFRRKNSTLVKYREPDLIAGLKDFERWVRKNRRDLFGGSSRDARRPLVRILLFAQPTQIGQHGEQMYGTLDNHRFLWVRTENRGTCYILSEDQLIDFIKAHLTP